MLLNIFSDPAFISIIIGFIVIISPKFLTKLVSLFGVISILIFTFYIESFYAKSVILAFEMAFICGVFFSLKIPSYKYELSLAFLYLGSIIGILTYDDIWHFFSFWEIATIAASAIIFMGNFENAQNSAFRYFIIHIASGLILLAGLVIAEEHGIYKISYLMLDNSLERKLIILAMLINIGAVPLSFWITDSYPKSSISGIIYLSSFTTKAAAFVIVMLSDGEKYILYAGLAMLIYGSFYTLLEENIRKLFCFLSISSSGQILIMACLAPKLFSYGVMIIAIIYNCLAMMMSGYLIHWRKIILLNQINSRMSLLKPVPICILISLLSLASFPFTISFISKSIIYDFVYEQKLESISYILSICHIISSLSIFRMIDLLFISTKKPNIYEEKASNKIIYTLFVPFLAVSLLSISSGTIPSIFFKLFKLNINYFYGIYDIIHVIKILFISLLTYLAVRRFVLTKNTPSLEIDIALKYLISKFFRLINAVIEKLLFISNSILLDINNIISRSFVGINKYWRINHSISLSIMFIMIIFLSSLITLIFA